MEVTIKQLERLTYRYIKAEKPFYVRGTMGIGKSMTIRSVAKKIAEERKLEYTETEVGKEGTYGLIDIRASQLDPSDLRGIPFPENGVTRWLPPSWLPTGGKGVIFFDEINLSPPTIQAALYQLILDRRCGDYILPDGWTIIAAGNRSSDKGHTFPMSGPLKDRFSHAVLLPPSKDEWRDWALENGIISDIIGFMEFNESMLHKFDSKSKDYAFPTHRSWATANELIKDIKGTSDEELNDIFLLTSSCVGEGAAREYQAFVKLKKKIKLDDIINNPSRVKEIKDAGMKYCLVSGLAERYRVDNKNLKRILPVVLEMDNEFGTFLMRLMKRTSKGSSFMKELMEQPAFDKLAARIDQFVL